LALFGVDGNQRVGGGQSDSSLLSQCAVSSSSSYAEPHVASHNCVSAKASRDLSLITIVLETNIMNDRQKYGSPVNNQRSAMRHC
jgi:hypothetical protein